MSSISVGGTTWRRARAVLALTCFAVAALLCLASAASAAELLYWDNYSESGTPPKDSVSFANVDGSGGGALNLGGIGLVEPEGMAIDTAGGRLFVASSGEIEGETVVVPGKILAVNLDGSGASVFSPPGAPVDDPQGIVVDPAAGLVLWANTGSGASKGSIAWAKLDGSAGGTLNTTGATLHYPDRLGFDPVSGRVFWVNVPEGFEPAVISYANVDNTGGGDLDTSGAPEILSLTGFAVDSVAGRLYWLSSPEAEVSYASVGGSGGGAISLGGATVNEPFGIAVDPSLGKLYWGNWGGGTERTAAIGFSNLSGVGGGIDIATAPVEGAQDPVILKSPTGTGAPALTRAKSSRSKLQCSAGSWAADYAGGFVYQAPTTYAYQWLKKGKPIAGATSPSYTAKATGKYSCTVTAANAAGTAAHTSIRLEVKAAKLRLSTKKKAKAKAGKLATFKLKAANQGDLKTGKVRICVKLAGKAKKALKRPKCKTLGKVAGREKKSTKVRLRVKGTAEPGTYRLTFQPKGAKGTNAKAKVVVVG